MWLEPRSSAPWTGMYFHLLHHYADWYTLFPILGNGGIGRNDDQNMLLVFVGFLYPGCRS